MSDSNYLLTSLANAYNALIVDNKDNYTEHYKLNQIDSHLKFWTWISRIALGALILIGIVTPFSILSIVNSPLFEIGFGSILGTLIGVGIYLGVPYIIWTFAKKKKSIIDNDYNQQLQVIKNYDFEQYDPEITATLNNLPVEFQNAESISQLHELIRTGRANSLPEAFNLLDRMQHREYVNSQLDHILAEQEALKSSNANLHSQLNTVSNGMSDIENTADKLRRSVNGLRK